MKYFTIINDELNEKELLNTKELFNALEKGDCKKKGMLENGNEVLIIPAEEAYRAVGDNQELIAILKDIENDKYKQCPTCGNMTNLFFKDYRSTGDCVGSCITCIVCCSFSDEKFHELVSSEKSNEEKFEIALKELSEL